MTTRGEKRGETLVHICCSHLIRYALLSFFVVFTISVLTGMYFVNALYHTEIRGLLLGNNVVGTETSNSSEGNHQNIIYLFDE